MTTAPKEKIPHRLCAITLPQDPNLLENVAKALTSGIRWIQYRQKDKSRRELYREALSLRELTRKHSVSLSINDYVDIALAVEADGIHVGQQDLPLLDVKKIVPSNMLVGVSTHSMEEALMAESDGADYIGFGPVFGTTTKDAGQPRGVEMARDISKRVNVPVFAIGGIDHSKIRLLLSSGSSVYGVAISSGIFRDDIIDNCKRLLAEVDAHTLSLCNSLDNIF